MVGRTLEEELAGLLDVAGFSARQSRAVTVRLGWDGRGGTTLQEAATREGYTQERVRQLEERLEGALRLRRPHAPRTWDALRLVERAAPDSRDHVATTLSQAGVAGEPFDPAGVIASAAMLGLDCRVSIRRALVLADDEPAHDVTAVKLARRLARREGAVALTRLAREVRLDPDRLRRLLRGHPAVSWLDPQHEWLQVGFAGRPIATTLGKMLAVSDPLELDDADGGLRRALDPIVVSRDALLRFCESCEWLRVDRDTQTVSAVAEATGEVALPPVERRLAAIFRSAGPTLTARQAIDLGVRNGLNPHTVSVYLKRSPILRRSGRGRYTLFSQVAASPALGVVR